MLSTPTYPGMYVEELSSGVHPISGVSTSDTAFIDSFPQGPMRVATRVTGFDGFLRQYGPLLDTGSPAGYAVMQFFLNGGQVAWIVRVGSNVKAPVKSTIALKGTSGSSTLVISAINEGTWGDAVQVAVSSDLNSATAAFNLVVRRVAQVAGRQQVIAAEVHRNVTLTPGDARFVVGVVKAASTLIEAAVDTSAGVPPKTSVPTITQGSTIA